MKAYLDILLKIVDDGKWKKNRTGIDTKSITGALFEHDMSLGFPLLTTKKMGLKTIATELEFFIQGMSDKQWLKDRNCHIWDDWCNPQKVPYGNDEETKKKMREENDLGRIYGVQWRDWRCINPEPEPRYPHYEIDQLKNVIDTLQKDPFSRRMLVISWNPGELDQQSLPPCHYSFQLLSDGESVDLLFNMRSLDTILGAPFNIASYGLLLEIIAKHVGMKARKLVGFFADVHVYENQVDGMFEQLKREPMELPTIEITNNNLFEWTKDDFVLHNYKSHPRIKFPIAV